jgi:YD repeat-containing protein
MGVIELTRQVGVPRPESEGRCNHSYTYQPVSIDQLETVTDPSGHKTQIQFFSIPGGGQKSTVQNANNVTTTFGYNSSAQPRFVLNALAQRISLTWTSGLLTALQDTAGNRTSLTYATMSDGRKFVSSLKTPQGLVYSWLYDTSDHVRATIDPLGNRMSYLWDSNSLRRAEIDALGNRTSYLYTSGGLLRALVNPLGQRTSALFDSTQRVRVLIDPLGNRSTYAYNSLGQPGPSTSLWVTVRNRAKMAA